MLRITVCPEADATILKLEGKLAGPWVEELRQVCARLGANHCDRPARPVVLTITDLFGTDRDGLELLLALKAHGVVLKGSGLVARSLIAAAGRPADAPEP